LFESRIIGLKDFTEFFGVIRVIQPIRDSEKMRKIV